MISKTLSLVCVVNLVLALGLWPAISLAGDEDEGQAADKRTSIFDEDNTGPANGSGDTDETATSEGEKMPEPEPGADQVAPAQAVDWILVSIDSTIEYLPGDAAGTTLTGPDGKKTIVPQPDDSGRTIVRLPDGKLVSVPDTFLGQTIPTPDHKGTFVPTATDATAPTVPVPVAPSPLDAIDWESLPATVQDAKEAYDQSVAEIEAAYAQASQESDQTHQEQVVAALTAIEAELDKAKKKAMQNEDLDLALAIRDAKEDIEQVDTESPATEDILIGTWECTYTHSSIKFTCTFSADKVVVGESPSVNWTERGRWTVTDTCVVIAWPVGKINGTQEKAWESFRLPLDENGVIIGDSWQGYGSLRAKKVE